MKYLCILISISLCSTWSCSQSQKSKAAPTFDNRSIMCGLSFVAPPKPFSQNPMPAVQKVSASWIAVIPYGFTRKNESHVYYNNKNWQWWGERPEGVIESIRLAKEAGIKVLLKPQVYIPGSWPGGLDFDTEEEWTAWESTYETFILEFTDIAAKQQVEALCIGTEFKMSTSKRPAFWRKLIQKIRTRYTGQLTYAANWDEYQTISFWDDLDFIGVDAYFPLVDQKAPSIKQLKKAWAGPKKALEQVATTFNKPILFTEFGYLSVDGCTYNNWELEAKVKQMPINEQAQADAYEALFQSFWDEPWWHGGFLWKWFPNGEGHEGYVERDYTPQGKLGEETLRKWYISRQ